MGFWAISVAPCGGESDGSRSTVNSRNRHLGCQPVSPLARVEKAEIPRDCTGGVMVTVMIGSYFEEEHVERIRGVSERLQMLYREDLVPPPRWPGNHVGPPDWCRSEEGEEEFLAMLG